jgi:homocysteine S-methyltransferase
MRFQAIIDSNPFIVAEGSVIEKIKRETDYLLDPDIANAGMIYDEKGNAILASIYRGYIETAKPFDLPIVILAPTWRASGERLERAGFLGKDVNRDCFEFLARIRDGYGMYAEKILVGGILGCRGDAYNPAEALDTDEARTFHTYQVEQLAAAGVDFLLASTIPSSKEAAGMAAAMAEGGVHYIISFIVRPSGELLDGTPLTEAITAIDASVSPQPTAYMLNCVHPDNARRAIYAGPNDASLVRSRLIGLQGNASRMSPEELDGRTELDADTPERWARAMLSLHDDFGIRILGGCCGTDNRHIARLVELYAGRRDSGLEQNAPAPVELPIDGTLDLHTFRPGEVKDLIPEYLDACRARGISQVRIIHGKGTGALRETVHAILQRLPYVDRFRLAGENGGGWGATIVTLRRHPGNE